MDENTQIKVTLVKAQTYIHQPTGLRFEFGVPRIVGAELAEYLFTNGVKSAKVTSGGRVSREDVRLFEFAPVDEDEDEDDIAEVQPDTLAKAMAKAASPAAFSPGKGAARANGGDGQARSRARGASAPPAQVTATA